MESHDRQPAPNYTDAALALGLVNLLWIFGVIWAVWGLMTVVVIALLLNHLLSRLEKRLNARR